MSKYHFSAIVTLFLFFVILKNVECVYFGNYPKLLLPEKAHNTIGEIPIIEHIDDGQVILPGGRVYPTRIITTGCVTECCVSYASGNINISYLMEER